MRKIVVLGAAQSGKSSLVRRYANNQFQSNEQPTLGLNVVMPPDSETQMWDASGQPRYNTLAFTSISGADGILLCYNVCNLGSFLEVRDFWLPKLHEQSNAPICLIGTHLDASEERRQVTKEEVQALVAAFDIRHHGECSAKTAQGMQLLQSFMQQLPVRTAHSVDEEHSPRPLIEPPPRGSSLWWCCCCCRKKRPIVEGEEIALE